MGTEDLDQADLERWDFTVPVKSFRGWSILMEEMHSHENTRQIELNLETNIDVRAVDRRAPPKREPTVRNLVETRPLRVRKLLVPH